MRQKIDAVYENGLIRPLEPLKLAEHERVRIIVERADEDAWLDHDAIVCAARQIGSAASLEEVRARLGKITGDLSEAVVVERGAY